MKHQLKPINQYIKDLSFENYAAQNNLFKHKNLELKIDLNIKKKVLKQDIVEITVIILLEAKNKNTKAFIIELSYASTFLLPQNKSQYEQRKFTFADCPTLMFPFVRQIVFNISRDSGFLPINLEYINFYNLFETNKRH